MIEATQQFRRSWKYPMLLGAAWTLSWAIVFSILQWLTPSGNRPHSLATCGIALVTSVAFFTLVAFALGWYYGLEAHTEGLRLRSWSGRYVEIPWQAIEEVDPMSLLGLPLLRVRYSGASRPAFMPLWLSDIDSLRAAVNAHAGERSVLGLWLMQHPRAGQFRF